MHSASTLRVHCICCKTYSAIELPGVYWLPLDDSSSIGRVHCPQWHQEIAKGQKQAPPNDHLLLVASSDNGNCDLYLYSRSWYPANERHSTHAQHKCEDIPTITTIHAIPVLIMADISRRGRAANKGKLRCWERAFYDLLWMYHFQTSVDCRDN